VLLDFAATDRELERFIEFALLDLEERQVLERRCVRRMKFAVALFDLKGAASSVSALSRSPRSTQDQRDVA